MPTSQRDQLRPISIHHWMLYIGVRTASRASKINSSTYGKKSRNGEKTSVQIIGCSVSKIVLIRWSQSTIKVLRIFYCDFCEFFKYQEECYEHHVDQMCDCSHEEHDQELNDPLARLSSAMQHTAKMIAHLNEYYPQSRHVAQLLQNNDTSFDYIDYINHAENMISMKVRLLLLFTHL